MSFFKRSLGIDLGTVNTLVFVPGKGIVINEPSVVAVDTKRNSIVAVGSDARDMLGKTPGDIVAYRPLKGGVIADYRVTETMLSYYINKALPSWSPIKPDVVISVPAGVTATERGAVIEAAEKAGAKNAYVIKEPILAAIGAGIPIQEPKGHMIVDIGGGTTDVAVISLGGIVTAQSVKCAGNRLDAAIIEFMRTAHGLSIGEATAEDIKIQAGSAIVMEESLVAIASGRDLLSGLPKSVEISSNEISEMIQNDLYEMIEAMKKVLLDTPPELISDVIDSGIIMTGGTSQLRNFSTLVSSELKIPATVAPDALYCVVRGAGATLEHLSMYKQRVLAR